MSESTEYKLSDNIADFIDFLSATIEQLSMSEQDLEEANDELCDITHLIELVDMNAPQRAKTTKLMRQTQKKRRAAKDNIQICTPIAEWAKGNSSTINSLKQLLGKVRKVEATLEHRSYFFRTDVTKEICPYSAISDSKSPFCSHSDPVG